MIIIPEGPDMTSVPTINGTVTASRSLPTLHPTRNKIQASFLIARPPPKSTLRLVPKCLLQPKLLLQIQQITNSGRPHPVLEIWQPPLRRIKMTSHFRQRPKLRSSDTYVTSNEPYITSSPHLHAQFGNSEDQDRDIVAVMSQLARDNTSASTIHFRGERYAWQANVDMIARAKGMLCYRFIAKDENGESRSVGRMAMQWEKRRLAVKDNASTASTVSSDSEYFVISLINHNTRQRSRIATMTRSRLKIQIGQASTIEHLQLWYDLMRQVALVASRRGTLGDLETWLYTHVLILGTWVADLECWLDLIEVMMDMDKMTGYRMIEKAVYLLD